MSSECALTRSRERNTIRVVVVEQQSLLKLSGGLVAHLAGEAFSKMFVRRTRTGREPFASCTVPAVLCELKQSMSQEKPAHGEERNAARPDRNDGMGEQQGTADKKAACRGRTAQPRNIIE